jgi:hypothetical protein
MASQAGPQWQTSTNGSANDSPGIAFSPLTEQLGTSKEARVPSGLEHDEVPIVTHDAFLHLPHLRGRLTPADKSAVRIAREALAVYDERTRKAGYPASWRHSVLFVRLCTFISETSPGHTNGRMLQVPTRELATRARANCASIACIWSLGICVAKRSCLQQARCIIRPFP